MMNTFKTIQNNNFKFKNIKGKVVHALTILFSIILVSSFSSCSSSVAFQKSSVVPAAEINVDLKQDKNQNYVVAVEVENLAKPEALTPERKTYVVWIESDQGTYNIGRLVVNDKLKGSLTGHSPYKPTKIKITAEDEALVTFPSEQVVLISNDI